MHSNWLKVGRAGGRRRYQDKRNGRRLLFEPLESRRLLAVDWRNPVNALDVTGDGATVPLDALNVINELNNNGSRRLADQKDPTKPFWDTTGDQFVAPLDALQVINALNAGNVAPYRLSEGAQLASQATATITLGQTVGTRTYRLRIDATFDRSDTDAVVDDVFAVYLVNPTNFGQTLLDRGQPGTALFTLSPLGAEFQPGLVRWDGSVLELDVSALTNRDTGVLKLQLLGTDTDTGTRVTVRPLTNEVDPEGTSGSVFPSASPPQLPGAALNLTGLAEVTTVDAEVANVRFDETTGRLAAEVRLRSDGGALGRNVAVAFPDLPAGVTLRNASGTTGDGTPYLNWQRAMPPGGLMDGDRSERVLVEFDDPSQTPFVIAPQILAGTNHAPTLDPIGPLSTSPGGVLAVRLVAADQDGDALRFAIRGMTNMPTGTLRADGTLEFRPEPNQLGTYSFVVIASDGALEATRTVALNVVADPVTTTRVSGQVLQVNGQPLANMPVEIGAVQGLTMPDGSFTLDLGSGPIVSDTIKVRGELFAGPLVYPFIAEKLPLVLEHDVYASVNNVIDRPIFLPSLDMINAKAIDPGQNTLVTTNAIPGASVFVAAGTLMNQQGTPFTGMLGMTEVPSQLTPAALPDNLKPDLVVTIQPGEMVFAAPAPLSMPNRAGWAPGTIMDLWSINPVTGDFDNVGQGQVSEDGSVVNTMSGGVRNSSWHFFAIPPEPNGNTTPPGNDRDKTPACPPCASTASATSEVELFSGALLENHSLVPYQSLGVSRGLSIHYDSLRADPRPIVHGGFIDAAADSEVVTRVTLNQGSFTFQIPGFEPLPPVDGLVQFPDFSGGEHFFRTPAVRGSADYGLQLDLWAVPTGMYEYTVTTGLTQRWTQTVCLAESFIQPDGTILCRGGAGFLGSVERASYSTRSDSDMLMHINTINSPFGSGWGLAGLQQIVENADTSTPSAAKPRSLSPRVRRTRPRSSLNMPISPAMSPPWSTRTAIAPSSCLT